MGTRDAIGPYALTALLLLVVASCGESDNPATDPVPELARITVEIDPDSILVGQPATASATGYDQHNVAMALGEVTWTTSVEAVVSITSAGSLTGVTLGTSTITATAGGKTGTATVAVVPPSGAHDRVPGIPEGWSGYGSGYQIGFDRLAWRSGVSAAYIYGQDGATTGFGFLLQYVRADTHRGRRVRWSGWVRVTDVTGVGAGLWMRVDGDNQTLAFDYMDTRRVTGTGGWFEVSVVLDVPANALGIQLGARLSGPGELDLDDLKFEVVGTEVPLTNTSGPTQSTVDSLTTAGQYAYAPFQPANLNFEGVPAPEKATVAWLRSASFPLATAQPGTGLSDLKPLAQMVGNARIVALGEGTHGTREFFQLKHRVFEFLVQRMGFRHFAIEASWAEANDVNRYVQTGEGDAARLLQKLYFWTWNTQEVLDLIRWMREWNTTAPAAQRVQFAGFDMQYPGAAMDTVASFIGRVAPAMASFVAQRYQCLVPFRDRNGLFTQRDYPVIGTAAMTLCRAGLQDVYDLVSNQQAGASADVFANALRSARIVQQWEERSSSGDATARASARDRFMAENTQWLLDQAGPTARMMLWAHNLHVGNYSTSQGGHLRRAYGSAYVNLGFLFGTGGFNAVGAGTARAGLGPHNAQLVPNGSLEALFVATGAQRLLFDARSVLTAKAIAAPIGGPVRIRRIGSVFNPAVEPQYFVNLTLPDVFDLLIYVRSTTPSVLLPFTN
jgi:erythromycin esterase